MPYMLRNRGVSICKKLKVCYSYCRISSADVGGGWGGRYSAPHLSTRRKGEYCAPTIKRLSEGAGNDRANHQENERQEPPERKEKKQQPQAKRKKPPTRRTTRGGTPTTPKDETRKDSQQTTKQQKERRARSPRPGSTCMHCQVVAVNGFTRNSLKKPGLELHELQLLLTVVKGCCRLIF